MNIYSYSSLASARTILSNCKTLDRFNKPLFDNSFILWAKKVIKFFKRLYNVAYRLKSQSINWAQSLSYAWKSMRGSYKYYKSFLTGVIDKGVLLLSIGIQPRILAKNKSRIFSWQEAKIYFYKS